MAYVPNYLLDDAQRRQQMGTADAATPGAPTQLGAPPAPSNPSQARQGGGITDAAPTPGGNAEPAGNMPSNVNRGGSTGFTNFATYLGLNKDAAGQMAGQLAGHVNAAGSSAQGGLDTALTDFNQKATAGTPVYNPNSVQWGPGGATPEVASLPQTGEKFYGVGTKDASNAAKYGATSVYGGPSDLAGAGADVGRLGADLSNASTKAKLLGSSGGVGALLRDAYGAGAGYSSGTNAFDAALAGNSAGTRFGDAMNRYGGLDKAMGLAEGDVAKTAQGGRDAASALKDRYNKEVSDTAAWNQSAEQQNAKIFADAQKRAAELYQNYLSTHPQARPGSRGGPYSNAP